MEVSRLFSTHLHEVQAMKKLSLFALLSAAAITLSAHAQAPAAPAAATPAATKAVSSEAKAPPHRTRPPLRTSRCTRSSGSRVQRSPQHLPARLRPLRRLPLQPWPSLQLLPSPPSQRRSEISGRRA